MLTSFYWGLAVLTNGGGLSTASPAPRLPLHAILRKGWRSPVGSTTGQSSDNRGARPASPMPRHRPLAWASRASGLCAQRCWLGDLDLNQDWRVQSPQSYH